MIDRLVIFGAKGDLMQRYLAPALVELEASEALPDGLSVVGMARDDLDDTAFGDLVAEALERHAPGTDRSARERLLRRLRYVQGDATEPADVARATEPDAGPFVAYLALPPAVFEGAATALRESGFPEGSLLVVEKPFGHDLDSARELNEAIHRQVPEQAVFRIDHFLGMQTVRNVLGLRFANRFFEPLWNSHHVARIEIVWDEALTVEGRAFYDEVGAIRDMVQNHLLQLLCLVAMEAPTSLAPRELRDRKVQLLRDVRRGDGGMRAVRARYTAGTIGDRDVPDYTAAEGIDPDRGTETFAELELRIDNWRWADVPILLRTGKALEPARKEVVIAFEPVPHGTFTTAPEHPNHLRLGLEPETLSLGVNLNAPGEGLDLQQVALDRDLARADLPAYGRVLRAALEGDQTLSIRDDEVEESWAVVDPVLQAFAEGAVPLQEYAAGSQGPEETLLGPR